MQKLAGDALLYRVPGAAKEPHPVRDAVCCLAIQGIVRQGMWLSVDSFMHYSGGEECFKNRPSLAYPKN